MSLSSRLVGLYFDLPPVETRDVEIRRDIAIPMPDGVSLLADHYAPRLPDKRPTILIRSPYGRARNWGVMFGRPFAERGFQVLIQSCRGTFGSGGTFEPFVHERPDGLATVAWMREQPWFSGRFAMFGASYLGIVQWAIADAAGPELGALAMQVTTSDVRASFFQGGSFFLQTALLWTYIVDIQEGSILSVILKQPRADRAILPGAAHLPLVESGPRVVNKDVPFLRDWLEHDAPGDPWWTPSIHGDRVRDVTAPATLLGGFYDVFLPQTLADYRRLREAGQSPYLTLGPWWHMDMRWMKVAYQDAIPWFRAHLLGDRSGLRAHPVRVFVMGKEEWREYDEWPPPGYTPVRHHLHPERALSPDDPPPCEPDRYRYDPADPTPTVGGTSLSDKAGPRDNRAVEARPDVLVYTSEPLDRELEIIGEVKAELFVKSTLTHTDFFARLCDVAPSGRSVNLCDGLLRLTPFSVPAGADGVRKVTIEMWPTAHVFLPGHRIRLQVSSGAHPRFARNTGSGEPLATATTLVPADQIVHHDPAHPSAILLPQRIE